MKIIFYSRANKIHFYKIGFALTFCKTCLQSESSWNLDMGYMQCKGSVEKKIQIGIGQCTVADIQLTQLHYIQCSCKQGLQYVAFGSTFTGWRGLVQLAYLHSSFHHTIVECQRHPPLGGSGGTRHALLGRFLKLDSLECNFLHSLEGNWLTGKVF